MKKSINIKSPQYLATGLVFILLFLSVSCEEIETGYADASLEVYVYGTLSGNPRDNIKVNLYYTESDAELEVNPVTVFQRTDNNGFTTFDGLNSNSRYWVRADALLSKKIKETQTLRAGFNKFDISIL